MYRYEAQLLLDDLSGIRAMQCRPSPLFELVPTGQMGGSGERIQYASHGSGHVNRDYLSSTCLGSSTS